MACARIGKSSLDIIWKREAGVLREAQYATAPSDLEHKKLVSSVYERRGTAPEIRAAIETDCIGEKQRAADTAAAIAVLQNAQGNTSAVKEPSSKVATPTAAAGESAPAIKKSINATQCADLNNELIFLQASSRRGGSVATMEGINAQRRAIDSKISSTKC